MSIAENVLRLRTANGWTQQQLADEAEMGVQQIKRYEAATSEPTVAAVVKLAQALDVTTDALIYEGSSDDYPPGRLGNLVNRAHRLERAQLDMVVHVITALVEHAERQARPDPRKR